MAHDHPYPAPGHNDAPARHLHSHPASEDAAADLQVLTAQFIDGFAAAADKSAYLRLAGIPVEMSDANGGPALKLVDVRRITEWQVGTASPSFGSTELSYLPFPGGMVAERSNLEFVYVSLRTARTVDLRELLRDRL